MTVVETHAPGTFCWVDLGCTDAAAAKRFYTGLFGWSFEDRPMGEGAYYTMFFVGGKSVAALYPQDPQQQAQGVPCTWLSYISVENADRMAERTRSLGGTVLMEPFDVLDVGRMAMVQDPTGAVVALWEPRAHVGAGLVGEPNSLSWNELATTDTGRAGSFYGSLLGWEAQPQRYGDIDYTVFRQGEQMKGGMLAIAPDWGPAQALGGAVQLPARDVPGVGRFAVIRDPQGAVFAIIKFASV
jgi:hypothetical protein